ncbi:MAG: MFS transporter [Armatimonadetes bacterium]|nr:MFS transporter [Armatimonadota bacterium]
MSDAVAPAREEIRLPPAPARPQKPAWSRLATMAFAHFTNDLFAAFLSPLLPLVVSKFHLSLTLAGLMGTMFNTSAAFAQPLFGAAADRITRPAFTIVGPLLTVLGMGLVGLAPSYPAMLLILFLTGVGTASFHPQSFALAGAAGGDRRGTGLSIFVAGGELGYALGPLYAASIVGALGLPGTLVAAVPGLGACALLWWLARSWRAVPPASPNALGSDLRQHGRLLALIWLIVVIRSMIQLSFILFLPLLLRQRGESLILGATAVFLFGGVGALGGLAGGTLSDLIGRRAVMATSFLLSAPLLFLFTATTGGWGLLPLALGGIAFYLAAPVTVAMAQELLPRRVSLASSMVTGMAWGTAGVSLTLVGAIADRIGLAQTLMAILGLALIALALIAALPKPRPQTA